MVRRTANIAPASGIVYILATVYCLYSILLAFVLAVYLPFYYFRERVLKKNGIFLRERLAREIPSIPAGGKTLWIHAVSVGEVISLQNLVRELKTRHPDWTLCFSTLTSAGIAVAREKLKEPDAIFYLPLDFPGTVKRVLRALNPAVLVLAESELWPNLLRESRRRNTKILLINGRISEGSFKKYSDIRPIAKSLLRNVDRFLMQTAEDGRKLELLGVEPGRFEIAGNLKSEVRLPDFTPEEKKEFRSGLGIGETGKVIVAGSTRKGEEERLLRAFSKAKSIRPDLRLILAPRHIERAGEIERLASGLGLATERRTRPGSAPRWDVLVLDTMGELARFYALCDAAFVGGSLVEWGGHNILEPAYYGRPVFFGPHMQNFAFLADSFIRAGGARIVRTDADLEDLFLLKDEDELRAMGSRAAAHLASLAGATERTIRTIERFMETEDRA
jgi:3-deoxy-D-manno-octulosonic-acid transferase